MEPFCNERDAAGLDAVAGTSTRGNSLKNITIAGNIGKSAEVRTAGQGKVTGWTVAVDDGWGDKKTTIWFDCNWWGQRGEKVAQYIQKGGKITVAGELSKREHDGKTYLTVNVSDVTLQSKADGGGQSGDQGGYGSGGQSDGGGYADGLTDSDIPF
jgi:single-strand DNA-binding protein